MICKCQRCHGQGYFVTYYGANPEADPRRIRCGCHKARHNPVEEEAKHESPSLYALGEQRSRLLTVSSSRL